MALSVVQSKGATADADTNAITFNSTTTTGNLIVVAIGEFNGTTFNTGTPVTDNKSNTYVFVDENVGGASATGAAIFYCENATGGASHQITVNVPSTGQACNVSILEISGAKTSGALDKHTNTTATASGTALSGTTATLAQADEIAVAVMAVSSSTNAAITEDTGGGWTLVDEEEDGTLHLSYSAVYKIVSSTSAVSHTWSHSYGSQTYRGVIATFMDAGGVAVPDLLTVTAAGTGNSATSTATLAFDCGASFAVGDWICVVISTDNNGTSGATSLSSVTDAGSNSYTLVQATYDPGAAAAGQTIGFAYAPITTAMVTTDQITINFSPNTTSKAAVVWKLHPDTGATIEKVTHGFGAGSATGTPTITTGTIGIGDCVIGGQANESNAAVTADADTTNGAWSTQATATGNTGTVATSSRIASQYKIVTAAATQTYNPTMTSCDNINGWIQFHPYIVNPVIVNPVVAVIRAASW